MCWSVGCVGICDFRAALWLRVDTCVSMAGVDLFAAAHTSHINMPNTAQQQWRAAKDRIAWRITHTLNLKFNMDGFCTAICSPIQIQSFGSRIRFGIRFVLIWCWACFWLLLDAFICLCKCDWSDAIGLASHTRKRCQLKSIADKMTVATAQKLCSVVNDSVEKCMAPHNWFYAHIEQPAVPSKRNFENHCLHAPVDGCRQTTVPVKQTARYSGRYEALFISSIIDILSTKLTRLEVKEWHKCIWINHWLCDT